MPNIIIPNHVKGIAYKTYLNFSSTSVTKPVKIVEISDLHLWTEDMIGEKNVLLAAQVIEQENPDVILITGDVVNDAGDLQNEKFRKKLRELIKRVTGDRLCIIEKGNHDLTTLIGKTWTKSDEKLLNEALHDLGNVFFLDDVVALYLKDNKDTNGFPDIPVNIVGLDLPWEFYFIEKENPEAFKKYWNKRFPDKDVIFRDDAFNILAMHAIGNFVELYDSLEMGKKPEAGFCGHYHGGMFPVASEVILPGTIGMISPAMKIAQRNLRGTFDCGETTISIGNSINTRVELPILNNNSLYGPSIRIATIHPYLIKAAHKIKRQRVIFK